MKMDSIMKQIFSKKNISNTIFIMSIIVVVKLIWLILSIYFLPKSGVEYSEPSNIKALYYRIKLAQINIVQSGGDGTLNGYKLLAVYKSGNMIVATIQKGIVSTVLSNGESVDGFELVSAGTNWVSFKKNSEEFKLKLDDNMSSDGSSSTQSSFQMANAITDNGSGGKVIEKALVEKYTKDMNNIWQDIGITERMNGSVINGFTVNFVNAGTAFDKLGLKAGDVIKSVNGEIMDSNSKAFSAFESIASGNTPNVTIKIERDNKEMELENEIK
ncbi:MAG: PDZ domain-containing protein [Sulfurovum sp.]|nr:MAG: PDZ domain-containing protein [Sulfurovum sp.]